MNYKDFTQAQLENIEKVLNVPNIKKIIDFDNPKVNDFIFNKLANCEYTYALCSLIKDGKVNNFERIVEFFTVFDISSKVYQSIPENLNCRYFCCDDEGGGYGTYTPFKYLNMALSKYYNKPNIISVAKIIAKTVSRDVSGCVFMLLEYEFFWNNPAHISKIDSLVQDIYASFQKLIDITKGEWTLFYRSSYKNAQINYNQSERVLTEYVHDLRDIYKKDDILQRLESSNKKESNKDIRMRYPY